MIKLSPGRFGLAYAIPLTLASILLDRSAQADIYRWHDENGIIHFSDRYPPSADVQEVSRGLAPLQAVDMAAVEEFEAIADSDSEKVAKARSNKRAVKAAERQAKRCAEDRKRLQRVQSQLRAGYSTTKGNRLREQRRSLSDRIYRLCRD